MGAKNGKNKQPQGYQQGYPQQGYPQQGYPQQGYPNQGHPTPNQGYDHHYNDYHKHHDKHHDHHGHHGRHDHHAHQHHDHHGYDDQYEPRYDPKLNLPAGDVVDLDPSTFNDVVMNRNYTVAVAFYAPWCNTPFMTQLLDSVARGFAGNEDIVITRVDADKYKDIFTHFDGKTLPCLFIFPKHDKNGIEYGGDRVEEEVMESIYGYHTRRPHRPVPRPRDEGPVPWERSGAHVEPYRIPHPPPARPEIFYPPTERHYSETTINPSYPLPAY